MALTVLAVDDDRESLFALEELLTDRGLECVCADSPETAKAAFSLMTIDAAIVDADLACEANWSLIRALRDLTQVPLFLSSKRRVDDTLRLQAERLDLHGVASKADVADAVALLRPHSAERVS